MRAAVEEIYNISSPMAVNQDQDAACVARAQMLLKDAAIQAQSCFQHAPQFPAQRRGAGIALKAL